MGALTKEIEDRALGLCALDRVSLAEKLLSSLDVPHQHSMDDQWTTNGLPRPKCELKHMIKV